MFGMEEFKNVATCHLDPISPLTLNFKQNYFAQTQRQLKFQTLSDNKTALTFPDGLWTKCLTQPIHWLPNKVFHGILFPGVWSSTNFIIWGILDFTSQYGDRVQTLLKINTDAWRMAIAPSTAVKQACFFHSTHIRSWTNSTVYEHFVIGQFAAQNQDPNFNYGLCSSTSNRANFRLEVTRSNNLFSFFKPSMTFVNTTIFFFPLPIQKEGFSDKNFLKNEHTAFVEIDAPMLVVDGKQQGCTSRNCCFFWLLCLSQRGGRHQEKIASQSIGSQRKKNGQQWEVEARKWSSRDIYVVRNKVHLTTICRTSYRGNGPLQCLALPTK